MGDCKRARDLSSAIGGIALVELHLQILLQHRPPEQDGTCTCFVYRMASALRDVASVLLISFTRHSANDITFWPGFKDSSTAHTNARTPRRQIVLHAVMYFVFYFLPEASRTPIRDHDGTCVQNLSTECAAVAPQLRDECSCGTPIRLKTRLCFPVFIAGWAPNELVVVPTWHALSYKPPNEVITAMVRAVCCECMYGCLANWST